MLNLPPVCLCPSRIWQDIASVENLEMSPGASLEQPMMPPAVYINFLFFCLTEVI